MQIGDYLTHPAADVFPMLEGAELERLANDIRENGLLQLITLTADGLVLDGRNRLAACLRAGVEPAFCEYNGADAVGFVVSKNLHRRHLDESQRAMVAARIATLKPWRPELSAQICALPQPEAADLLQVSRRSVQNARAVLDHGTPSVVAAVERGDIAVSAAAELARHEPEKQDAVVERIASGAAKTVAEALPHVAHNSGDNEWYTPAEYIEAAREVMGEIDLDPASSELANQVVKATRYYTAETDGLSQEWEGRVWMNPPYAKGLIEPFVAKLVDEYIQGTVTEAIVLVNNATDTKWFQQLMGVAAAMCFPAGRVRFLKPDGERGAPLQGQAVLYFGFNPSKFLRVFAAFGIGCRVVREEA